MDREFGYVRAAAVVPPVRVGKVDANLDGLLACAHDVADAGADLAVFPELCVTGYTCADLFAHGTLLDAAESALAAFADETREMPVLFFLGAPIRSRGRLFNCGIAVQGGMIIAAVPKIFLPNYGEFYDKRWFTSGLGIQETVVRIAGHEVPFGTDVLFTVTDCPRVTVGVELCEDLWAPTPPSTRAALAGATILVNLSASNDLVGKTSYRRRLVQQQSAACLAAYVYTSAGAGESTTDVVYGGHRLIAENGRALADERTFAFEGEISVADLDVDYLEHERRHSQTFSDAVRANLNVRSPRIIDIAFPQVRPAPHDLLRTVPPLPFVPSGKNDRIAVCEEIFAIQSTALATRLKHTEIEKVVIGLSGGLDSTLALLVCVEAFARLGLSRTGIHAITMPGFGTTERTVGNVRSKCDALKIHLEEIDIRPSCRRHFADIGHPEERHDTTFENVQARERTQVLMDKANAIDGLVVGTGDLSELALGWCTYNADHMSMYAVNIGVPKTLVAFLIEYVADTWRDEALTETLRDVLSTPISPELLPPDEKGLIQQKTEEVIGPYELHDFFLYALIRCGFSPRKTLFLALKAFADRRDVDEIRKWLEAFIRRFFAQQFKRSCIPDGPKIGTIALSPRGDWRMPSDADPSAWIRDLDLAD